jgi:sugar (pentulose or hexulose) kinase
MGGMVLYHLICELHKNTPVQLLHTAQSIYPHIGRTQYLFLEGRFLYNITQGNPTIYGSLASYKMISDYLYHLTIFA